MKQLLVDVHTHIYLPRYAEVLRSRSNVPRIFRRSTVQGGTEERLLILDNEPSGGRPVGSQVGATKLLTQIRHLVCVSNKLSELVLGSAGKA